PGGGDGQPAELRRVTNEDAIQCALEMLEGGIGQIQERPGPTRNRDPAHRGAITTMKTGGAPYDDSGQFRGVAAYHEHCDHLAREAPHSPQVGGAAIGHTARGQAGGHDIPLKGRRAPERRNTPRPLYTRVKSPAATRESNLPGLRP